MQRPWASKSLRHTTATTKPAARDKKYAKRLWAFYKIPDLLDEIQRKAERLEKVYGAVSFMLLYDIRTQQRRSSESGVIESTPVAKIPTIHEHSLEVALSTEFASIDLMVGTLMKECKLLRQRLQEVTLCPDTSAVEDYQEQHPEGASFWRDRFHHVIYSSATFLRISKSSLVAILALIHLPAHPLYPTPWKPG